MSKAYLGRVAQHKDAHFHSARLWFFPAAIACLRLQEMRRRSRGMGGPYTLAGMAHMSAAEAASGYMVATTAVLGQFTSASPETRVRMFLHVVAYVQAAGDMDGLESLMLSGIDACHVAGASDAARTGMALWNRFARSANSKNARVAVFLSISQRIGFIGGHGSSGLPHFGAFGMGKGDGPPGSVFSPGMPGSAIGRQLAGRQPAIVIGGGFEKMDGIDFCHGVVKYGVGSIGAVAGGFTGYYTGGVAGSSVGPVGAEVGAGVGAVGGFIVGGAAGVTLGKEIGTDFCGGSSPAQVGETVVDHPDPGVDTTSSTSTYLGEVDDPNFVSGGSGSGDTSGSPGSGSGSSTDLGEVDDPNFVPGGSGSGDTSGSSGSGSGSGDTSGSSGSGSGSGDTSGSSGSGSDTSGGTDTHGGMDNPETGTDEHGGHGPHDEMPNPETGAGGGPRSRCFIQGGYAVTTQTFVTQRGLQGSVRSITPALYHLQSLPLLAESSVGPIFIRTGLLESALPPASQSALNQKGLVKQ